MDGLDDAASGFAADGEADEAGGGGGAGAGARAGGAFFEEPGVHGLAAEPDVVERECADAELGDEDGAGVVEAFDDGGVGGGDAIAEGLGAVGGGDVRRCRRGLLRPRGCRGGGRDNGRRRFPCRLALACARARSRVRVMTQWSLGSKRCEAIEVDVGEAFGGELAGFDPAGEMRDGREGDVGVA